MEKISIKRALSEIKHINIELENLINNSEFVTIGRSPSSTQFSIRAKKNYNRIQDLISRRETLKSRIVDSNAVTKVTVCGKEMTVAQVIDMKKRSIIHRKYLLDYLEYFLKANYSFEILKLIHNRIEGSVIGRTIYDKEENTEAFAKDYMAKHPIISIDPLNLQEKVNEEKAFITEFNNTVDDILYISSCTTFINV